MFSTPVRFENHRANADLCRRHVINPSFESSAKENLCSKSTWASELKFVRFALQRRGMASRHENRRVGSDVLNRFLFGQAETPEWSHDGVRLLCSRKLGPQTWRVTCG